MPAPVTEQLLAGRGHGLADDLQRALERGGRLARRELVVGADPDRVVVGVGRAVGDPAARPSIGAASCHDAGRRSAASTSVRGWAIGFGSPGALPPTSSSN